MIQPGYDFLTDRSLQPANPDTGVGICFPGSAESAGDQGGGTVGQPGFPSARLPI